MAKLALCIKRADAPQAVIDAFNGTTGLVLAIDPSFWQTPVELVDRAICETDETWLQLLPYIVVNTDDNSVFMYTRGGGGAEARLHGNYSVGVGGHVDIAPLNIGELLSVLQLEASREIMEEIEIDVQHTDLTPTHFICDPTNPVGRVHLGLLIGIQLPENTAIDFVNGLEAGSIENASSVPLDELAAEPINSRLENWSRLVAAALSDESTGGSLEAPFGSSAEAEASDADWDNPDAEVGGELIADEEDEDANDGDDEENICGECDTPVEDCECQEDEEDEEGDLDAVPETTEEDSKAEEKGDAQ